MKKTVLTVLITVIVVAAVCGVVYYAFKYHDAENKLHALYRKTKENVEKLLSKSESC